MPIQITKQTATEVQVVILFMCDCRSQPAVTDLFVSMLFSLLHRLVSPAIAKS